MYGKFKLCRIKLWFLRFEVGPVVSVLKPFFPRKKSMCRCHQTLETLSLEVCNTCFKERKKVSNTEAATYLELLLESAAALLVAVQLLFGGRGLVSDLLQLLKNVRHSRLVVSRGYLIKKSHIGANF